MFNILQLPNFVKKYTNQWYINILTYPEHLDINTHETDVLERFKNELKKAKIPNKEFITNHLDCTT
jgi:hypothetical protein